MLLQLQRGGRIASHIDLEIEDSEEPVAQSRDSLPVSSPGGTGEQSNHMLWLWLTSTAPSVFPPCHMGMDGWHLLLCIRASALVFKQAPGHLNGCVCIEGQGTKLDCRSSTLLMHTRGTVLVNARQSVMARQAQPGRWHAGGLFSRSSKDRTALLPTVLTLQSSNSLRRLCSRWLPSCLTSIHAIQMLFHAIKHHSCGLQHRDCLLRQHKSKKRGEKGKRNTYTLIPMN